MRCTVLLFAQLAEIAETRAVTLDLADGARAADALEAVCARWPAMQPLRDRVAMALDDVYVAPETALRDGAEVALIPPVSGG